MVGKVTPPREGGQSLPGKVGGHCNISHKGSIMLMGFKTVAAAHACYQRALTRFKLQERIAPHVVNMVWKAQVPVVDGVLDQLAAQNSLTYVNYDIRRFAGAIIESRLHSHVKASLFHTGSLVIAGAHSRREARDVLQEIEQMVLDCEA
jgi:TATA-box binding protein (TBP) (component of TFIID and TFIIIB)